MFGGFSSVYVSSLYLHPYRSICEVVGSVGGEVYAVLAVQVKNEGCVLENLHYSWVCVPAALTTVPETSPMRTAWACLWQPLGSDGASAALARALLCLRCVFYPSSLIHTSQRPTKNPLPHFFER